MSSSSSFSKTCVSQNFSIPNTLIYYISHESCDALLKLLLCCKFFYLNYKIIPCQVIEYYTGSRKWAYHCSRNLENLPSRLWLFNKISFLKPPEILQILPKIYRFDISSLTLSNEIYYFRDLKKIFSSTKLQELRSYAKIIYSDGSIVPVEALFEAVPYVNEFYFRADTVDAYTYQSAQKLLEINRSVKLKYFGIFRVPENFNLQAFKEFAKKNASNDTSFTLVFNSKIKAEIGNELISKCKSLFEILIDELKIQNKKFTMVLAHDSHRIVFP